jgi:prefoldin alpha subunit
MDQQKYVEYQLIAQQVEQIEQYLKAVENQLVSIQEITKGLRDFKKILPGTKILVPIQNGIFAEAELKANSDLKVNIGSQVIVKKNVDDTIQMMQIQKESIMKQKIELMSQYDQLTHAMKTLQKELQ